MTKLTEEMHIQEVEELKKEILQLKNEVNVLRAENLAMQETTNSFLQKKEPENEKNILDLTKKQNETLKYAENTLAYERELFQGIFNNIPVLITIYEPSLKNFKFNKEMKDVLGWTEEDAGEGAFLEKVYPDPDYRRKVIEYMTSLQSGWQEFVATAKDGTKVISSWANILLTSGVQIGIGIDIRERKKAEIKLLENEQRLQAIFNYAAIGIVELDDLTRFISVNNRICELLGYTQGELLKKSVLDITAPEDRAQSYLLYEQLHKGEVNILNYEKNYVKSDGSKLWVLVSVVAIRDNLGRHLRSIGTVKDITERKETEQALHKSEARFRLLADNISQMAWITNERGEPVWYNKQWVDYTGENLDDIRVHGYKHLLHPDHINRVRESFSTSIAKGEPWEMIYPLKRKDGNYRWFLSRALPILDHNENITLWFGTNTDITEQRNIEETLRENEQRLEGMFSKAAIGIVEVDENHRMIAVNERLCKILEYSQEELIGKNISDITAPEFLEISDDLNSRLHKGELDIFKYEKQYLKKDGSPVWVYVSVSAIRDSDGRHIRSIGTIEDITDRKKTEQALLESEERLRIALESAELGTWDFDIETGIAIHSLRHDQIFGYTELQPEWSYEISIQHMLPEYHPVARDAVARALKTGILAYEAKILWPDGSTHWIAPHGRVKYSEDGKPLRMVGIVADVTERKMAEEAMIESEEKFRSLFENITEGVAIYELVYENNQPINYRLIDANPAYKEDYRLEKILAPEPDDAEKSSFLKEYANVATTRKPYRFETFLKETNKYFIINVISPRKGQFATVFEDITEFKNIEQEMKQRNEELTRFIYTVSHDLKSPLVTIKSFTSFLKTDIEANAKDAVEHDIGYIVNAADKMGKLLDELLELSRIGRTEEKKTEHPLAEIAQAAIDLVAGRIKNGNVEVRVVGIPVMIYGHTQRLIQLYQN